MILDNLMKRRPSVSHTSNGGVPKERHPPRDDANGLLLLCGTIDCSMTFLHCDDS